ncbi:MAG: hypothetical protein A2V99_04235 [Spirochaetes bacterium RBG_16_67_19]|nr:MAG: hypothetical protein A2V99_04235 [Spirochaetes bacterium RBG_16_67_19]
MAGRLPQRLWHQPHLAAALLLGLLLPDLLLRLPAALRGGWPAFLLPSLEALLLAAILAVAARLWPAGRRIVPPLLAAAAGLLFLFSLVDALLPLYFNRRLALATDLVYLPDLYRLLRDTVPRWQFVGGLVLLPLGLAGLGYGLARAFAPLYMAIGELPRRGVVPFVLLGTCAAAVAVLVPGEQVYQGSSLPRLGAELASLRSSRSYRQELRQEFNGIASPPPLAAPSAAPLSLLQGRDVFLFIVESYGYTLYSEPVHFALAEPFLRRIESRLAAAGFRIASNFLDSPAFGGNSWLADSTLAAGVRIPDQTAYEELLASQVKPMAAWFNEAGYLTVNSMPATTMSWPEGDFYRFQRKFYFRDFGYRGPSLKWAPMTDQFAVAVVHRQAVAPARQPVFVQYVMISGHYPFSLIPRLFEDWSELGDGSVYAREGAVRRMPVPPGATTAGPAGYAAAMEYQLEVAADYAVRFLAGRQALIVVVGDHQPYSGITGQGKTRSVPIHIWSREPELLGPFLRRGYTPGLVPRHSPPHAGLESFWPAFLEDFSPTATAGR